MWGKIIAWPSAALLRGAVLGALLGSGAAWDCGVNQTAGEDFGVGGPDSEYADGTQLCWVLRGAAHVTLVFGFFHTEHNHDTVTVYDGVDDAHGETFSGELPSPMIIRSERAVVMVAFRSDAGYHTKATTKQKGFLASYFDSSDGSCYNGCSGHGRCDEGLCYCDAPYAPDVYGDCSMVVAPLVDGTTLVIDGLAVGEWAYFRVDLPKRSHVLVELVDRRADVGRRFGTSRPNFGTLALRPVDVAYGCCLDEATALVEVAKHGGRARVEPFDRALVEVGRKTRRPRRSTGARRPRTRGSCSRRTRCRR